MQRTWDSYEYNLYQRLKRPIGGNQILKNEEEYNEYWGKIDWIRDWIKKEDVYQEKEYKLAVCKSKVYNTISILMLFVAITLPFPLTTILKECFHIYMSTSLLIFIVIVLFVVGVWFAAQGGDWNGESLKKPRKATVEDLLESVYFRYGTPLVLALEMQKIATHRRYTDIRLCSNKHIYNNCWHGLLEPELYMLLADALILDECLSNQYKCKKQCVKCKAKEYNDNCYYYFHWRSIYKMSPTDIIRVYQNEYLGRNGSLQPLPQHIEQRRII